MSKFIDSHSHLNFPAYDEDRAAVIERMAAAGVGSIDIGTTTETSRAAVALAQKHDFIWAAVGIHPTETPTDFETSAFRELLENRRVVAVGECGLDYFRFKNEDLGFKNKQKELFGKHIDLAKEKDLPLVIHCRSSAGTTDAYDDLYGILRLVNASVDQIGRGRGVMHFYTGDLEHARKFIELGFFISFSGVITFAEEYEPLVRELPLDKILIETDCPYASPAPYRGKRNEPTYVVEIAKKIAELKNVSLEEVAEQTTINTQKLFNL